MRYLIPMVIVVAGCYSVPLPKVTPKTQPAPFVPSVSIVSIGAPENILSTIHTILGESNAFTLRDALTVKSQGISVALPAGCFIEYATQDTVARFKFPGAKPIITYGVFHPRLEELDLISDTTAVASVVEAGFHFKKTFHFGMGAATAMQGPDAAEPDDRPVMYVWGDPATCVPCKTAHDALKAFEKDGKKLPFQVVFNPDAVPKREGTIPLFEWSGKEKMPDKELKFNYSMRGWKDIQHLIREFQKTRMAKSVQVAGSHTHTCYDCIPPERWGHPDNSSTASHKCPRCGREVREQDS